MPPVWSIADPVAHILLQLFMLKLSITRGVYHKLVQTLDEYARETTVAAGEDHGVGAVCGLCGEGSSSDEE